MATRRPQVETDPTPEYDQMITVLMLSRHHCGDTELPVDGEVNRLIMTRMRIKFLEDMKEALVKANADHLLEIADAMLRQPLHVSIIGLTFPQLKTFNGRPRNANGREAPGTWQPGQIVKIPQQKFDRYRMPDGKYMDAQLNETAVKNLVITLSFHEFYITIQPNVTNPHVEGAARARKHYLVKFERETEDEGVELTEVYVQQDAPAGNGNTLWQQIHRLEEPPPERSVPMEVEHNGEDEEPIAFRGQIENKHHHMCVYRRRNGKDEMVGLANFSIQKVLQVVHMPEQEIMYKLLLYWQNKAAGEELVDIPTLTLDDNDPKELGFNLTDVKGLFVEFLFNPRRHMQGGPKNALRDDLRNRLKQPTLHWFGDDNHLLGFNLIVADPIAMPPLERVKAVASVGKQYWLPLADNIQLWVYAGVTVRIDVRARSYTVMHGDARKDAVLHEDALLARFASAHTASINKKMIPRPHIMPIECKAYAYWIAYRVWTEVCPLVFKTNRILKLVLAHVLCNAAHTKDWQAGKGGMHGVPMVYVYSAAPNTGKTQLIKLIQGANGLHETVSASDVTGTGSAFKDMQQIYSCMPFCADDFWPWGFKDFLSQLVRCWYNGMTKVKCGDGSTGATNFTSMACFTSNVDPASFTAGDAALLQRLLRVNPKDPGRPNQLTGDSESELVTTIYQLLSTALPFFNMMHDPRSGTSDKEAIQLVAGAIAVSIGTNDDSREVRSWAAAALAYCNLNALMQQPLKENLKMLVGVAKIAAPLVAESAVDDLITRFCRQVIITRNKGNKMQAHLAIDIHNYLIDASPNPLQRGGFIALNVAYLCDMPGFQEFKEHDIQNEAATMDKRRVVFVAKNKPSDGTCESFYGPFGSGITYPATTWESDGYGMRRPRPMSHEEAKADGLTYQANTLFVAKDFFDAAKDKEVADPVVIEQKITEMLGAQDGEAWQHSALNPYSVLYKVARSHPWWEYCGHGQRWLDLKTYPQRKVDELWDTYGWSPEQFLTTHGLMEIIAEQEAQENPYADLPKILTGEGIFTMHKRGWDEPWPTNGLADRDDDPHSDFELAADEGSILFAAEADQVASWSPRGESSDSPPVSRPPTAMGTDDFDEDEGDFFKMDLDVERQFDEIFDNFLGPAPPSAPPSPPNEPHMTEYLSKDLIAQLDLGNTTDREVARQLGVQIKEHKEMLAADVLQSMPQWRAGIAQEPVHYFTGMRVGETITALDEPLLDCDDAEVAQHNGWQKWCKEDWPRCDYLPSHPGLDGVFDNNDHQSMHATALEHGPANNGAGKRTPYAEEDFNMYELQLLWDSLNKDLLPDNRPDNAECSIRHQAPNLEQQRCTTATYVLPDNKKHQAPRLQPKRVSELKQEAKKQNVRLTVKQIKKRVHDLNTRRDKITLWCSPLRNKLSNAHQSMHATALEHGPANNGAGKRTPFAEETERRYERRPMVASSPTLQILPHDASLHDVNTQFALQGKATTVIYDYELVESQINIALNEWNEHPDRAYDWTGRLDGMPRHLANDARTLPVIIFCNVNVSQILRLANALTKLERPYLTSPVQINFTHIIFRPNQETDEVLRSWGDFTSPLPHVMNMQEWLQCDTPIYMLASAAYIDVMAQDDRHFCVRWQRHHQSAIPVAEVPERYRELMEEDEEDDPTYDGVDETAAAPPVTPDESHFTFQTYAILDKVHSYYQEHPGQKHPVVIGEVITDDSDLTKYLHAPVATRVWPVVHTIHQYGPTGPHIQEI